MNAETAATPDQRQSGLMYRRDLPLDAGMVFIWSDDTGDGFWMKNTYIPLSVAFVDSSGTIIGIQDMAPLTEDLHFSPHPYRYAIEANQGYFASRHISAGGRVEIRGNS